MEKKIKVAILLGVLVISLLATNSQSIKIVSMEDELPGITTIIKNNPTK